MSEDMILPVLNWAVLAIGSVMIAQSVYVLVTGRFPPLYSKGDRALPARPHAWFLLLLALAMVVMVLPRALDWPAEWQIVSTVLGLAFVAGGIVARSKTKKAEKAKKAESATESRDIHRTP